MDKYTYSSSKYKYLHLRTQRYARFRSQMGNLRKKKEHGPHRLGDLMERRQMAEPGWGIQDKTGSMPTPPDRWGF